jgi:glycosyltransferase involved in cell wall biosynthesis
MTASDNNKPSVFVIGLRGFPDVPGGVETHAENLYPLILDEGFDVLCATRSPYHDLEEWSGIQFVRTWAPKSKFLEAILHSTLAVLKAAISRPDVVHVHAVGPSLVVPLARLLGLRVVVTHHGPDYDREKWNALAKAVLKLGERFGMRYANERIVISPVIADIVKKGYNKDSTIIPNGVRLPELDQPPEVLEAFNLESGRYLLLVSRLVPEKRHLDLIEAFERLDEPGLKLALVGGADHPGEYDKALAERAKSNPDIVMTGFRGGNELKSLFQHARVFVLPSSHEGLPISLLEALSFGLPCVASDIPANVSVGLDEEVYFPLGDIDGLTGAIRHALEQSYGDEERSARRKWVAQHYDWKQIATQTAEVYRKAAR